MKNSAQPCCGTAKKEGFTFAMPCEKSGQDEFDFDYGDGIR